jgi:hypothetical protein
MKKPLTSTIILRILRFNHNHLSKKRIATFHLLQTTFHHRRTITNHHGKNEHPPLLACHQRHLRDINLMYRKRLYRSIARVNSKSRRHQ